MRDSCLLLFTKPARPGRVKTRLIGNGDGDGLSPVQAADLHPAFLDDLRSRLASGAFSLSLAWAMDGDEPLPETGEPSVRQRGADLGERLFAALAEAARRYRFVGAVGSDHPELSLTEVERGFSLLREGADVVLGPATDGGYYFIGVRAGSLRSELFEGIEWSTPAVLEDTLERCRRSSLAVALLEEGSDVDTPADLDRLWRRLEGDPDRLVRECPRTSELLRVWRTP